MENLILSNDLNASSLNVTVLNGLVQKIKINIP